MATITITAKITLTLQTVVEDVSQSYVDELQEAIDSGDQAEADMLARRYLSENDQLSDDGLFNISIHRA